MHPTPTACVYVLLPFNTASCADVHPVLMCLYEHWVPAYLHAPTCIMATDTQHLFDVFLLVLLPTNHFLTPLRVEWYGLQCHCIQEVQVLALAHSLDTRMNCVGGQEVADQHFL